MRSSNQTHFFSPAARAVSCVVALSAAACGAGSDAAIEPEVATDESAVTSQVMFPDASCAGLTGRLTDAVTTAKRWLSSPSLGQCLEDAILSGTDASPEIIVRQMTENTITELTCANLEPPFQTKAPLGFPREAIAFDRTFAATGSPDDLAAAVVHGITRVRGYAHPEGTAKEYPYSVAAQVTACARTRAPNGPLRGRIPVETTLAPTGREGGSVYRIGCPQLQSANGIQVRSGSRIEKLGLLCESATSRLTDGTADTVEHIPCPTGQVLVGLAGRASSVNDAIAPICVAKSAVVAGDLVVGKIGAWRGGTGGITYTRHCPAGMVIRALHGKAASAVDRIEIECGLPDSPQPLERRPGDTTLGGSGGSIAWEECVGRAALVGITHQTGTRVDRLGGTCAPVVDATLGTSTYAMNAHGGTGGVAGDATCKPGEALVGLRVHAGSGIDAIGAACAPFARWIDGSPFASRVEPTYSTPVGGGGGTVATSLCRRGSVVSGWRIGSGDRVDSVQLLCRDF
jgi:hypothetical protein